MRIVTVLLFVVFPSTVFAQVYIPIKKGESSPINGVVMTEKKALSNADEKIEFKKLKADYSIDKDKWEFKEGEYIRGLDQRDAKIAEKNAQLNSWWNRNKFEVGVMLGMAAAIAIAAGMNDNK